MPPASRNRSSAAVTSRRGRVAAAVALLTVAVGVVYGEVHRGGFVEFDDPGYVTDNAFVRRGLTAEGIRWAFTTGHMWNWHPLTWLSHMLDVQLFGLAPGRHHLVNVAFHLASTLLLFAVLRRMTGALWPSFTVAALFGVHPLHVESVAWISERKDVLSGCCFFLMLWAYAVYGETHSQRWYAVALGSFALGLMAKPMLVTAPFVLLLLDIWPLRRLRLQRAAVAPASRAARRRRAPDRRATNGVAPPIAAGHDAVRAVPAVPLATLLLEKVPFFALTVAASIVTYVTQQTHGAMEDSGALPLGLRTANALLAYARYLAMAVWPTKLAVFYPYDMHLPAGQVVGAGLCLATISVAVVSVARRHPYAAVGWLLYLGMLVPVIGLVQVGSQALADRFTYLPLVGIFIIVAWGGRELLERAAVPAPAIALLVAAAIITYAALAREQVGVWRDGATLFGHAVRVTKANYLAHNNLGTALEAHGRLDAAIEEYRQALRIKPDYTHARHNLAHALRGQYEQVLAANPDDPVAHYNLAGVLRDSGQVPAAIGHYERALRLRADYGAAHTDLAGVLVETGRLDDAVAHYERALHAAPDDARTRFNLGSALARMDRLPEAVSQYEYVVRLTPDDAEAWGNLAMAHAALRQESEATRAQQKAVELARAQGQWGLVKTLEDWWAAYRAALPR
jgi:tetratricopeptide (TPR) repeat protein